MDKILRLILIITVVRGNYNDYNNPDGYSITWSEPVIEEDTKNCQIYEETSDSNLCTAKIRCLTETYSLKHELLQWMCLNIKPSPQFNYETEFNQRFYIDVSLRMVDTYNEEGSLEGIDSKIAPHVKSITLESMSLIPERLIKLTEVQKVVVQSSNITKPLDLNNFTHLPKLFTIIISESHVSTIETDKSTSEINGNVVTIDLSYNDLETLPQYCFAHFPGLLHLNLSHNQIKEFDLLTFEGLVNLEVLDVSHNEIKKLGHNFAIFVNLIELSLAYNQLETLEIQNFETMKKLQKLNINNNLLESLPDDVFHNLVSLTEIDLNNNLINYFSKKTFANNNNLHTLIISNNNIKTFEPGAFQGKNITLLETDNNAIQLYGPVDKYTFEGIYVNRLDFSFGNITELGDSSFADMGPILRYLNLSSNSITKISPKSFISLEVLLDLDLSHNLIEELSFDTTDLEQLTNLFAHNNLIKRIRRETFKNLRYLTLLDLSHNFITEIDANTFDDLNELQFINLEHTNLLNTMPGFIFKGFSSLLDLDMGETTVKTFQNNSFSGMHVLRRVNASHGELVDIEFNSFINTGNITEFDLSFNLIEFFFVNTSFISTVEFLALQYNKISHISKDTFKHLSNLRLLYLQENTIHKIDSGVFKGLSNLESINLASNTEMEVPGNVFTNLDGLYEIVLRNLTTDFTFRDAYNMSTIILDMSLCNIKDLNSVFIYVINNVHSLLLRRNNISFLNKFSFKEMESLKHIDLSSNFIIDIQPGTFLMTKNIGSLNLHGNRLESLRFGIFEGLSSLVQLNLSNNMIQSIAVNDFHNTEALKELILDNNKITDIKIEYFAQNLISIVYVDGNLISCNALVEFIKNKLSTRVNLKAANPDYHQENVDGIPCEFATSNKNVYDGNKNLVELLAKLTNATITIADTLIILANNTKESIRNGMNRDLVVDWTMKDALREEKDNIMSELHDEIKNNDKSKSDSLFYFIAVCLAISIVLYIVKSLYNFSKSRMFFRSRGFRSSGQALTSFNDITHD